MPAVGSSAFTDADGYQAGMRDTFDLLVPRPAEFCARLTWLELAHLHLLRANETSARVAYLSLPPAFVFVTFPTERRSRLLCDGTELQFGKIMFHGRGDRLHQRTVADCHWGSVSLTPAFLMTSAMAVAGHTIMPPPVRRILCPSIADLNLLLRLHSQAGRMAETVPTRIGHNEVVRALEQDLILALLNCLTADDQQRRAHVRVRQSGNLVEFEAVLGANPCRLLRTKNICDTLGITARTLRARCSKLLGMSPGRYQRLRRLKLMRAELMRPDAAAADVPGIMERYGFPDISRFMKEYWHAYGEMPPIPRRGAAGR